jgi:putative endonuclease
MTFHVYILKSQADGSFYVGYTRHLTKRLKDHNDRKSRYTARKVPWSLFYSEAFETKREALIRERFLKRQKNRAFYMSLAG